MSESDHWWQKGYAKGKEECADLQTKLEASERATLKHYEDSNHWSNRFRECSSLVDQLQGERDELISVDGFQWVKLRAGQQTITKRNQRKPQLTLHIEC